MLNKTRKFIKFIFMNSISKGIIWTNSWRVIHAHYNVWYDRTLYGRDYLLPLAEVYLYPHRKRGIECCRIVFICLGVPTDRNQFATDARSYSVCLVSALHNSLFGSGSGTVQMWDVCICFPADLLVLLRSLSRWRHQSPPVVAYANFCRSESSSPDPFKPAQR